jgi:cysteinyl-tRNA synthetase
MDLRILFLSSHYRSSVDFSWESITQAHKNIQKINDFVLNLEAISSRNIILEENFDTKIFQTKFEDAMNDDFNTPLALASLYELITKTNSLIDKNEFSSENAKNIISLWKKMNKVFGLILSGQAEIPDEIKKLMEERANAKSGKDFARSDELRSLIEKRGYLIEDTKDGQKVKSAK